MLICLEAQSQKWLESQLQGFKWPWQTQEQSWQTKALLFSDLEQQKSLYPNSLPMLTGTQGCLDSSDKGDDTSYEWLSDHPSTDFKTKAIW